MTSPIAGIIQDAVDVAKAAFRSFINDRMPHRFANAAAVRAADLANLNLIYVSPRLFEKDTSDTTTADDGTTLIRDVNGIAFKAVAVGIAITSIAGSWSGATTYGLGALVSHGGFLFASRIEGNTNNEPDIVGDPGDTTQWMLIPTVNGDPGSAVVTGTSSTSLLIGAGSKVFTVEADRGWANGTRLRASSNADVSNFMEGVVTSYAGTTLTLNVVLIGGAGTFADWRIGLVGQPGAMTGPGGSTANGISAFLDGTGNTLKSTGVTIDGSDNVAGVNSMTVKEVAAPATPAAGNVAVYAKSDNKLYIKDDTGAETDLTSGGAGVGNLQSDMRLAFLKLAELDGDRLNMIDGISDAYGDETDIDGATSTGETYDAAGDFYASFTSGSTQENTNTWADNQLAGGITFMDRTFALNNGQSVTKIGTKNGAAESYTFKIFKRNSPGNYDVVRSESGFTHGGGGDVFELFTLASPYAVPSDGALYYAGFFSASTVGGTTGSFTRGFAAGDITGNGQSFTEDTAQAPAMSVEYGEVISTMDLRSNAFTADAEPTTGRLHGQIAGTDAATLTLNTDLIGYVSRDGGTTWTAATLVDIGTLADGTKLFEDADIDISGQPSGTAMKYRWLTANNARVQVKATCLQWA
jgi:hypothetical protein